MKYIDFLYLNIFFAMTIMTIKNGKLSKITNEQKNKIVNRLLFKTPGTPLKH